MATASARAPQRLLAALLVLVQALLGCPPPKPPLAPVAGFVERRTPNLVPVPGGLVDVAGGKLLVSRRDLSLDTRLGTEEIGAVYDSVLGAWRWSFELRYDGATFSDGSGASFAVAALPDGAPLPGTWWVKRDASRIATKGGLVHEFGANGLLAARYFASDPYPRIRYTSAVVAGAPRITAIEQCTTASSCTPLFALGYDAAGQLVSLGDHAGRRAEFTWDTAGRLASARDGLDVAKAWPGFRYTYAGPKLASQTNSEGERVEYTYAGNALASAKRVGPGNPTTTLKHEGRDASGLYHTRVWNPLGEERRYAYDAEGRLAERHDLGSGERTTWVWSGERMASETLPHGATTTWSWSNDDPATRTDPSGNVTSFTYAAAGVNRETPHARALASASDALGAIETRSYDAAGRLVAETNGAGETTTYTWAQGLLASQTRAGVTRTFSQYGAHGHAEFVAIEGFGLSRAYDAVGNLLRGPDDAGVVPGGVVARGWDADRNLASLALEASDPAAPPLTVTLEHRSDGQRLRVLRGGDDHEFAYDAFGRVVEQRERVGGAWQVTRFGWDAAGRQTSSERPNGMREEVVYGPSDRPAVVRRLRSGALEHTLTLVYEGGLLASVADSSAGTEQYERDAAGRVTRTVFAGGERTEHAWDARSRLAGESFVTASGGLFASLSYEHDLADRRTRIGDAGGLLWSAVYAGGRLAEVRTGNGAVRSFAYGDEGLLAHSETRDGLGALMESSDFTSQLLIDDAWFFRQRATTTTYGSAGVTTVEEYELRPYPGDLQGTGAGPRVTSWHDGLSASEVYAFDAKSNLLQMGDVSFQYNGEGNRLLGMTRAGQSVGAYAWDAAGFATARNGAPLEWNAAGRLTRHGADTLTWDGLGRLQSAQVGGATSHFRFGGRIAATAAGQPLALDLGEVVVGAGGAHRYRHLDFRGNVKFVSDEAADVVAHYRYAPFGLDAVFGADDDPVRFAARAELGALMLLGARVYDPAAGRFLSPDPIFQNVNQFAYTLGNPVWFDDADGMQADPLDIAGLLESAGQSLKALGLTLQFSPNLRVRLVGQAMIALGEWLISLAHAKRLRGSGGPVRMIPSLGGASGGTGGFQGGSQTSPGCSPAALTALPALGGWLRWLVPLQLLLGVLLLRRRRRTGSWA